MHMGSDDAAIALQMLAALGGGASTLGGTYTAAGALTVIRDTATGLNLMQRLVPDYHGWLQSLIFVTNMAGGDVVNIEVDRLDYTGAWRVDTTYTLTGVQANQVLYLSVPYLASKSVRIRLNQTAGVLRNFEFYYNGV